MSVSFSGLGFRYDVEHMDMYSDNTPMVKIDAKDYDRIVERADTVTICARSLAELIAGLSVVDGLDTTGGSIYHLVLPYLPGARQDRVNPGGDVAFMSNTIADLINSYNFMNVTTVDPHSDVMADRLVHLNVFPLERIYSRFWHGYTGIIAPDKGAQARAELAGKVLDKPVIYGGKTRDAETGKITGFTLEGAEKGGHYLVVDDICDGGGTFLGLADKIDEAGAYADLYVTHGIFSKGTHKLARRYKTLYTTDTWPGYPRPKPYVFNVVEEMESM